MPGTDQSRQSDTDDPLDKRVAAGI